MRKHDRMLEERGRVESFWSSLIGKEVKTLDLHSIGNLSTCKDSTVVITSSNRHHGFIVPKSFLEAYDDDEVYMRIYSRDLDQFHF